MRASQINGYLTVGAARAAEGVSRFFPDIMVSPCWLVGRRLTLLDSVEPTFFGKPTIYHRSEGLSLALRLHKRL
jgi:hypothetical protein